MRLNSLIPENYRGRFPFRLATTSYIYPDKIVPNVARLAPSFDEIELVFFESESQDNLLHEDEIKALTDLSSRHGLTYHIHLPLDIFLGDEDELIRTKGISTVQGMIERTLPLNPSIYTLHLERRSGDGRAEADVEAWKGRILQSLEEIVRCELESKRISIETLEYPFEWVEEIVEELKLSICLDIGHLLTDGQDLGSYLGKYLANTSIVHLHGFQNDVDHLGIDQLPELALKLIITHLRDYHGIVSLEVFSIDDLKKSLITLEEKWGKR